MGIIVMIPSTSAEELLRATFSMSFTPSVVGGWVMKPRDVKITELLDPKRAPGEQAVHEKWRKALNDDLTQWDFDGHVCTLTFAQVDSISTSDAFRDSLNEIVLSPWHLEWTKDADVTGQIDNTQETLSLKVDLVYTAPVADTEGENDNEFSLFWSCTAVGVISTMIGAMMLMVYMFHFSDL